MEFDQYWELEIGNGSEAYPQLEYTGRVSMSQPRRMGYPLSWFLSWTPWLVVKRWASEKYTSYMVSSNKKSKRNLSESYSENEAADFPRFIVIKSLEDVCLAKFLPFLIEKVISTRASSKTVKKTRNGNLLVEVDSRRQEENIKNKNLSYDQMQGVSAWETQHFQGSYQE